MILGRKCRLDMVPLCSGLPLLPTLLSFALWHSLLSTLMSHQNGWHKGKYACPPTSLSKSICMELQYVIQMQDLPVRFLLIIGIFFTS